MGGDAYITTALLVSISDSFFYPHHHKQSLSKSNIASKILIFVIGYFDQVISIAPPFTLEGTDLTSRH